MSNILLVLLVSEEIKCKVTPGHTQGLPLSHGKLRLEPTDLIMKILQRGTLLPIFYAKTFFVVYNYYFWLKDFY